MPIYCRWLGTEPAYTTYGFGGQRLAVNLDTHRVIAILSDTYYKDAGLTKYDDEDPTATFPTDLVKDLFVSEPASTAKEKKLLDSIPVVLPYQCATLNTTMEPETTGLRAQSGGDSVHDYSSITMTLAVAVLVGFGFT